MNRLIRFTIVTVCAAALLAAPLAAEEQAESAAEPIAEQAAPDTEEAAESESAEEIFAAEQESEAEIESEDPSIEEVVAAEPAEQEIEEEAFAGQAAVSETEVECVNAKSGKYTLVYSFRPELTLGMARSANGVGGAAGFGVIHDNLYTGADISGGAYYFGGDANIGIYLKSGDYIGNVFGLNLGFWRRSAALEIPDGDIVLGEENENTFAIGGMFWKFLYGKQSCVDVTNKIMFGYRDELTAFASYDPKGYTIRKQRKFAAVYSFSVGLTIKKSENY